jgi:uncharacterized phage-associated protein
MNTKQSFACANYILDEFHKRNEKLNNYELNKILYCAYGVHLILYEKTLFDEKIQAWNCGPVVPSILKEFKAYSLRKIESTSRAKIMEDFTGITITPDETHLNQMEYATRSMKISCTYWRLLQVGSSKENIPLKAWEKALNLTDKFLIKEDIIQDFMPFIDIIANDFFK